MKGSKIWLIIAVLMLVSGLGLAAIGTANGGTWKMRFDLKDFKVKTADSEEYVNKTEIVDEFSTIKVITSTVDINIENGDKYSVTYYVPEDKIPEIRCENGVLTVDTNESNSVSIFNFGFFTDDKNPYITITTPSTEAGNKLDVRSSTGDIKVTGLGFDGNIKTSTGDVSVSHGFIKDGYIKTSTGDITVDYISSETIETETSTGEFKLSHSIVNRKLTSDTSTGDIQLNQNTINYFGVEGSTSDITVLASEIDKIDIKTSTGEVELELKGSDSYYNFDLHTSTGDIRIGNQEFEKSNKKDYTDDKNYVNIQTSTGDIDIDFVK